MREEWLSPSPRLRTVRHLEVAAVTVVVAVLAGAIAWLAVAAWAGAVAVVVALAAGAVADVSAGRRVHSWGYAEREDDLLVRHGVLVRRLSVIPYGRMQFIDVTAGPVERTFDLATVRMHTAAAASDARIPGLDREVAARLRDRLAELGEARATGL